VAPSVRSFLSEFPVSLDFQPLEIGYASLEKKIELILCILVLPPDRSARHRQGTLNDLLLYLPPSPSSLLQPIGLLNFFSLTTQERKCERFFSPATPAPPSSCAAPYPSSPNPSDRTDSHLLISIYPRLRQCVSCRRVFSRCWIRHSILRRSTLSSWMLREELTSWISESKWFRTSRDC